MVYIAMLGKHETEEYVLYCYLWLGETKWAKISSRIENKALFSW